MAEARLVLHSPVELERLVPFRTSLHSAAGVSCLRQLDLGGIPEQHEVALDSAGGTTLLAMKSIRLGGSVRN